MKELRSVLLLLFALVAASCQTTPKSPAATAAPAALPNDIKWVQQAAEYQALALQAYRIATARVVSASQGRARGSWAVILDADETVINNAAYQAERARQGLAYSTESWHAWVLRREATPIPGARAFLARVRDLGGRIAIVTNRLQSECADTEAVFKAHALVYDAMLCRPTGAPSDKNPRFQAVAGGTSALGPTPLEVLLFVGDNILDFPQLSQATRHAGDGAFAEFGDRFVMLPNPMYGSWQ